MNSVFPPKVLSKRAASPRLEALWNTATTTIFIGFLHPATPRQTTRSPWMAECFSAVLFFASSLAAAADIYSSTDANGVVRWSTQAWDTSYHKAIATKDYSSVSRTNSSLFKTKAQTTNTAKIEQRRRDLYPLIDSVARRFAIDTNIIMALIEVESGFDTQAVSPKGARGLMQLMPNTAAGYGVRDIRELHDPERNLDIGIRHLKNLLAIHGGQWALALASYNAGQGAVAKHGQRIPRYIETMLYVPAVLAKAARPETEDQSMPLSLNIAE